LPVDDLRTNYASDLLGVNSFFAEVIRVAQSWLPRRGFMSQILFHNQAIVVLEQLRNLLFLDLFF